MEVDRCRHTAEWLCPQESQGPPSPLLFVNKESREHFFRFYKLFLRQFPTVRDEELVPCVFDIPTKSYPITYFNAHIDTLLISENSGKADDMYSTSFSYADMDLGLRTSTTLLGLQYMAISEYEFEGSVYTRFMQQNYPLVKSIQIVEDIYQPLSVPKIQEEEEDVPIPRPKGEIQIHDYHNTDEVKEDGHKIIVDSFEGNIYVPFKIKTISRAGQFPPLG